MLRVIKDQIAMGVPVVVTAVGGPSEVVRDGVEGRVLAPRDPERWSTVVLELLSDPATRERMGRAGRDRARSISDPAVHATAIEAIYRRLAS